MFKKIKDWINKHLFLRWFLKYTVKFIHLAFYASIVGLASEKLLGLDGLNVARLVMFCLFFYPWNTVQWMTDFDTGWDEMCPCIKKEN